MIRKQTRFFVTIASIAAFSVLVSLYQARTQAAEANNVIMTCIPDRPIAYPGDSVAVEALTNTSLDTGTQAITWQSSVGKIEGKWVATWLFPKDKTNLSSEAPAIAQAFVKHKSLGEFECQLRVYFVDPPLVTRGETQVSNPLLSGRTFLLPGKQEPEGYGLYSYFLLGAPPENDTERERYLQALESYLLVVKPIDQLERYRDRSRLNITLLPLKVRIDRDHDLTERKHARALAIKLLNVYHYERAKVLLSDFGIRTVNSGPFLVSRSVSRKASNPIQLELDMSHVSPHLVWHWTKAFCLLATQELSWPETTLLKFFLNVRNVIAIAAKDTPIVVTELDKLIRLVKSR